MGVNREGFSYYGPRESDEGADTNLNVWLLLAWWVCLILSAYVMETHHLTINEIEIEDNGTKGRQSRNHSSLTQWDNMKLYLIVLPQWEKYEI